MQSQLWWTGPGWRTCWQGCGLWEGTWWISIWKYIKCKSPTHPKRPDTDYSRLVTGLSPWMSLKATAVNAFWWAWYSLLISPVFKLHSLAALSLLAVIMYWLSAVKLMSHTHLWASQVSSCTRVKSTVLHTFTIWSAADVTRNWESGLNLQQRPYLLWARILFLGCSWEDSLGPPPDSAHT